MKNRLFRRIPFLLLALFLFSVPEKVSGQCMYYPVSLEQRVDNARSIVLGRVISKHCYKGPDNSIYTLNFFQVDAYLKNNTGDQAVCIITMGGVLEDQATIAYPALQLDDYNEYILFLDADNFQYDDKTFRAAHPDLIQCMTYADGQGALTGQFGFYHDLLVEPKRDETETFARISSLTGEPVTTPEGDIFTPRVYDGSGINKMMPITGFAPSPTNGGTIVPGEFLNITGSGFGAGAGTVFYTNADDGGATFTSTGVASDNVSWADGAITNKVARRAGTGPINVNGAMTSGSNLTVNYAHLDINSNFSGFGVSTRQRYYHRNLNAAGGVYFLYNTTSGMSGNAPAVAAMERALQTWRCLTFINWFSNGTTASGLNGVDGVNVILFDGTLAAGVLGQAVSNFSGSANGGCTLANTVWWVADMDLRMKPDPPSAGFPWEYGPVAPAFAEYDFESVAAHEFGHLHGLGHRIASGQVMNFAIANGAQARTPDGNEVSGGAARMAYSSAATCFNPVGSGTQMVLLNSSTCLLPVTLLDFHGAFVPNLGNRLNWTTANEVSNNGFEIERSYDGSHFEKIAFVPGSGNTSDFTDYEYLDESAGVYPVYYYRLVQVDLNGDTKLSNTIEIFNTETSFPVSIYPSVTSGVFTIQSPELNHASIEYTVYSADGKLLLSGTADAANRQVNATSLSPGIYLCKLTNATGKSLVKKFVKVNE